MCTFGRGFVPYINVHFISGTHEFSPLQVSVCPPTIQNPSVRFVSSVVYIIDCHTYRCVPGSGQFLRETFYVMEKVGSKQIVRNEVGDFPLTLNAFVSSVRKSGQKNQYWCLKCCNCLLSNLLEAQMSNEQQRKAVALFSVCFQATGSRVSAFK